MITGATGYIGGRLVAASLDAGLEVCAIVVPGDPAPLPDGVLRVEDPGDAPELAGRLGGFAPDAVMHLAASQNLTGSPVASDSLVEANVAFGSRVLAASSEAGARALVAASSYSVHATGTADYAPQTLYSATKQAFTALAEYYRTKTQLTTVMLELSDTYGPADARPKFLNLVDQASRTGEVLEATPGEQVVRPLHVDDIVSAFLFAADSAMSGALTLPSYSVAGPDEVTLRQLVAAFEAATGRRVPIAWGARPYRAGEIMQPWAGQELPGWTAEVRLTEGLARVYGSSSEASGR